MVDAARGIEGADRDGRDAMRQDEALAEGHIVMFAQRADVDVEEVGSGAWQARKAEAGKAREATEASEAERRLARINCKNKKACNEIQNVWTIKSLK